MPYVTQIYLRSVLGRRLTIEEIESNMTGLQWTADAAYNGLDTKADIDYVDTSVATAKSDVVGGAGTDSDTLAKLKGQLDGLLAIVTSDNIDLNTAREWVQAITSNQNLIDQLTTDRVTGTQVTTAINAASAALSGNVPFAGSTLEKLYDLIAALSSGSTPAGAASKLVTSRQIRLSGDIAGQANFDGSMNINIAATLPAVSGLTAGTYGDADHVAVVQVNEKGQVVGIAQQAVNVPSSTVRITGDVTGTGLTGSGTSVAVTLTRGTITTKLGFEPESTDRKAIDFAVINNQLYPTVKAVSDFINTNVQAQVTVLNQAMAAEATARGQAIAQEVSERNSAIATAVSTEATSRDAAISGEATARDAAISTAIASEVSNRNSAISTAITTEVTNRNTAISTAVSQEVSDRNAAITASFTRGNLAAGMANTVFDMGTL